MNNFIKHNKTVITHKIAVAKMCFKMGIYWQGITHDLSKFGLTEESICKYYIGTKSPHEVAREKLGYSPSWIHHYHVNKHHYQYWLDTSDIDTFIPIKMPYKYVIEMFCDRVGASKTYLKNKYNNTEPLKYFKSHNEDNTLIHEDTKNFLVKLLTELANSATEEDFVKYYKANKNNFKKEYEKC